MIKKVIKLNISSGQTTYLVIHFWIDRHHLMDPTCCIYLVHWCIEHFLVETFNHLGTKCKLLSQKVFQQPHKTLLYRCITKDKIFLFFKFLVRKGKQGTWNSFLVTLCMETFQAIFNGDHIPYSIAITTRLTVLLRVIFVIIIQ